MQLPQKTGVYLCYVYHSITAADKNKSSSKRCHPDALEELSHADGTRLSTGKAGAEENIETRRGKSTYLGHEGEP